MFQLAEKDVFIVITFQEAGQQFIVRYNYRGVRSIQYIGVFLREDYYSFKLSFIGIVVSLYRYKGKRVIQDRNLYIYLSLTNKTSYYELRGVDVHLNQESRILSIEEGSSSGLILNYRKYEFLQLTLLLFAKPSQSYKQSYEFGVVSNLLPRYNYYSQEASYIRLILQNQLFKDLLYPLQLYRNSTSDIINLSQGQHLIYANLYLVY